VSVEEVEPGLADVLTRYPENIVFASDYPHADGIFPGATKELLDTEELDDTARRRVLRDNAVRLYDLEHA
jgi:predicted TIM-barrel fold metal-dependent hydrolase